MSGAAMLALGAAVLAMAGGLFGTAGRAWRMGAGLAVALIAGGVWFAAEPAGEIGHAVQAVAHDASGAPVSTVLVLGQPGGRRDVRRAVLSRPIEGAEVALWAAIALGLLGAGMQLRVRPPRDLPAWVGPALPVVGALAPLVVFVGVRGSGSGEAGVRAWLASYEPGVLQSFTVPELPWTYGATGTLALAVGAGVTGLALASLFIGERRAEGAAVPAVAAALATAAVIWQIAAVGGLAWQPVDGALWAVAGLLALAFFDRAAPMRAATLVAPALALAAVAAGG